MSKFTKQAIMDGFIELSKQMPIDKITVKKVTDYIGITRNTFYYHYQDIYALLEEIVVTKAKKLFVLDEENLENSWKSNMRFMGQYGKKNEVFIRNLYQSMGRDACRRPVVRNQLWLHLPECAGVCGKRDGEKSGRHIQGTGNQGYILYTCEDAFGKCSRVDTRTCGAGSGRIDGESDCGGGRRRTGAVE